MAITVAIRKDAGNPQLTRAGLVIPLLRQKGIRKHRSFKKNPVLQFCCEDCKARLHLLNPPLGILSWIRDIR
jgi:hypothetical protein